MAEWAKRQLHEVVELRRGFDLPHRERRDGPYPVLSAGTTAGWHAEGPIRGPGLVIGRATNLGQPTWSDSDYWPLNTTLYAADFKGNWPRWVFHLFEVLDLSGFDSGSVQPMLNRNYVARLAVCVPPLSEQRAIAEVLGALDDKIAANTRVAQRARKLAEAEFVALSSTRTERSTVGAIMKLEYGKALPTNQRTSGGVDVFGSGGVVGSHDKALVSAPGVVVGRKGTAGAVHWAPRAFFPIDTTFYVVPRSESISAIFCYFTLRSLKLAERNSDSAVPGLNRAEAESAPIMLPPVDALTGFTENATALFDLATQADSESASLAATRDALLPALMSGKLRVRDAERAVEQVV